MNASSVPCVVWVTDSGTLVREPGCLPPVGWARLLSSHRKQRKMLDAVLNALSCWQRCQKLPGYGQGNRSPEPAHRGLLLGVLIVLRIGVLADEKDRWGD